MDDQPIKNERGLPSSEAEENRRWLLMMIEKNEKLAAAICRYIEWNKMKSDGKAPGTFEDPEL